MKKIIAITDYKGHFGSKWEAEPYRSGFDRQILTDALREYEIDIEYLRFQDVNIHENRWKNQKVIYTSSEEFGLYYKSFIEDIVFALELAGAHLMPDFPFLKANNNKVFMELLRDIRLGEELSGLASHVYGTLEELKKDIDEERLKYPCVVKQSAGAMSRGVYLTKNKDELLEYARNVSNSSQVIRILKERIRTFRHSGYKPESQHQNKFIVQPFIPGLSNDWKVIIFGNHYYVLKRGIKDNDFRASGSGYDYKAGSESEFPVHLLDWVQKIFKVLNVPHLSLDVAYDGERGYLFEYQAVYFGTATLAYCNDYFIKQNGSWKVKEQQMNQEEEYAWSLAYYLDQRANEEQ